jgi:predicted small lipoprotein YifL
MKVQLTGIVIILCLGSLTGCGNSGDLYLPEDASETYVINEK